VASYWSIAATQLSELCDAPGFHTVRRTNLIPSLSSYFLSLGKLYAQMRETFSMDALTMFATENLRMPEEINRPELNDPAAVAHPAWLRSA
jgi:hypothetical protein